MQDFPPIPKKLNLSSYRGNPPVKIDLANNANDRNTTQPVEIADPWDE